MTVAVIHTGGEHSTDRLTTRDALPLARNVAHARICEPSLCFANDNILASEDNRLAMDFSRDGLASQIEAGKRATRAGVGVNAKHRETA